MDGFAGSYRDRITAVTGSRGYLASRLIQALEGAGSRVVAASRPRFDPRTRECWDQLVASADVIFHLAGNTSVADAARDPDGSRQSTVTPLVHLAAAARHGRRRLTVVLASTATVYGLTERLPVDEDATLHPVTVYDAHKVLAEQHLAAASLEGLIEGVSLRVANVYGPSPRMSAHRDRGVLNRVARQAVGGQDLSLFGDGNYVRDYVYIDDVVRAFAMAGIASGMSGRSFNVASGRGVTVREAFHQVAASVRQVTGRLIRVQETPWQGDADPIERRNFTARVERMAAACGWVPQVSLEEGIDRLVHHVAGPSAPS